MSDFSFTVNSPKYGLFVVTVPDRFKKEINQHIWHVLFDANRSEGRQFVVGTNITSENNKQVTLLLHILLWHLITDVRIKQVDHIDGNPLNNSESNLRDGSIQNQHNQRSLRRDNKSGIKGVSFHKSSGKWQADIRVNNKTKYLGLFDSILDAKEARDAGALRYHGEFAVTNEKDIINV